VVDELFMSSTYLVSARTGGEISGMSWRAEVETRRWLLVDKYKGNQLHHNRTICPWVHNWTSWTWHADFCMGYLCFNVPAYARSANGMCLRVLQELV